MIKILHRYNSNKILHEVEAATTIAEAVTKLVKEGADLRSANLRGANLRGANLRGADLRSANLYGANLYGANLRSADLRSANLYGANLRSANLRSADLRSADLRGADLENAKLEQFRICPEGTLVGWKKVSNGNILRLEIPADAQRVNRPGSRKCRASYARVEAVYNAAGDLVKVDAPLVSSHDAKFTYTVGAECHPDRFEADIRQECAPGIHFFITFEEARDY